MRQNFFKYYFVLFFFIISVYLNSFTNPFIWDDYSLIVENPYVKNLRLSFKTFYKDIYFGISNFYRPLQIIIYALTYKIFRLNPIGYHFLNILLHYGCTILFFILLKEIYGEKMSFLVSLLWAIHPIHTEAITYISGTADSLFLFFGLIGIYLYNKNKKNLSYIFFVFSLLSKETSILILPLFFLYQYSIGALKKSDFKNYLIIICIFLSYIMLRLTILKFERIKSEEIFLHRFYTGFVVFLIYISLLIFPLILSVERHIPYVTTFKNLEFIIGLLYFLIFLFFLYFQRKKTQIFFPGIIFILTYLFHSNIIVPLNGNLREHWMYLGSVGMFIYIIEGLIRIKKEKFKLTLIILLLFLYGLRTVLRNYDWKDPEKFYLKSIKYSFSPSLLYGNLGYYYIRNGEYFKGYQISQKAILLGFKNESILYVYGISLLNLGKYNEAEFVLNEILNSNPKNYEVLTELSSLYYLKGEREKSLELLKKSLKLNDAYPKTYYLLSEIYKMNRDKNAFLDVVNKLMILVPDDFYPYYLKGLIFKEEGDFINANKYFQKAYLILKNKTDFYSLFNLGILIRDMGKIEESLNIFKKLLEMKPENIEILNEIGICYALKGDKEKAKNIWNYILTNHPEYYPAKGNLKKLKF